MEVVAGNTEIDQQCTGEIVFGPAEREVWILKFSPDSINFSSNAEFFNNRIPNLPERLEELRPTLEASEESPAHDGRGDAERPVDVWVKPVVPLRCDSIPLEDADKDIANEDAVEGITNEEAVKDITNECVLEDITSEDDVEDLVEDITNKDAREDISEKEDAHTPYVLETDLVLESLSEDDFSD
nr:uncharacterized protein LOC101045455 [Saimiri boliviensis boliviensis]